MGRLIYRSRLAFDGVVLHQLPRPPIVRVCRSMGVCCAGHQLLLSFVSRVRWRCAVLCQPPPPPLVRISRPMGGVLHQPPAPVVRISCSMWLCQPPRPPIVCISRLMGVGLPLQHPLVRVSCSMGVGCPSTPSTSQLAFDEDVSEGVPVAAPSHSCLIGGAPACFAYQVCCASHI